MENTDRTAMLLTLNARRSLPTPNGLHYDDQTKRAIHRFLAYSQMTLESHLRGVRDFAGRDRDHVLFAGQISYLENAISTVKLLAHRVNCRQRHLLFPDDSELERIGESWRLASTNYGEQRLFRQFACDTTEQKDSPTAGDGSSNGQPASSGTVDQPHYVRSYETVNGQSLSPSELAAPGRTAKLRAKKNGPPVAHGNAKAKRKAKKCG